MKPIILLLLACFTFITITKATNNDSTIVASSLKSVVVYKSGAEMEHTTSAFIKQGTSELIIDGISNQLDINSVQVKTASAVTVMGIEFSNNYLKGDEKKGNVKSLHDSLERINTEIAATSLLISNAYEQLDLLKSNKYVKGEQTGLSIPVLMNLMDYFKNKSLELESYMAKLNDKNKKAQENAVKIANQIKEEERKNIATTGRLSVQLSSAITGKYDFTISYITQNASWLPFYDVRVDNINGPVKIIYKAKVIQTTGIDWKQVKLSLSTSLPAQWNRSPELNTWFLSYVNPLRNPDEVVVVGYDTQNKAEASIESDSAPGSSQLNIRGISTMNQPEPLYIVNGKRMRTADAKEINPSAIKSMKVLKDNAANAIYGAAAAGGVVVMELKDGLDDYISVGNNTLDVSFDIDIPYDVPTNGKAQTAILQILNVPATYNYFSVPKLDKGPYLLAQITGWEKLNLLPGEANIIVENTYIGKSVIDPSSTSDTLILTLGRDKRVAVTREKLTDYSSVKFLGSNKLQKFTYEITVRNNKKDSINFLLEDQYPISTDKDIEVELIDNGKADVNKETGLLNWKLNLAPGENIKLRFTYTIKYPRNRIVK